MQELIPYMIPIGGRLMIWRTQCWSTRFVIRMKMAIILKFMLTETIEQHNNPWFIHTAKIPDRRGDKVNHFPHNQLPIMCWSLSLSYFGKRKVDAKLLGYKWVKISLWWIADGTSDVIINRCQSPWPPKLAYAEFSVFFKVCRSERTRRSSCRSRA